MTITEALSDRGINALLEATNIGKTKFGADFKAARVVKLLKRGYWMGIETTQGTEKLSVKHDGKCTIISRRGRSNV